MSHLNHNKKFSNLNHSFRSGFSCDTQLITILHDFGKSFDQNLQTDIVYGSKLKGAKSDTHHTNLFITYRIMIFLIQFLFVALKLKDSRVLEKEIRRKHANIREHEVKVTVQI